MACVILNTMCMSGTHGGLAWQLQDGNQGLAEQQDRGGGTTLGKTTGRGLCYCCAQQLQDPPGKTRNVC